MSTTEPIRETALRQSKEADAQLARKYTEQRVKEIIREQYAQWKKTPRKPK